MLLIQEDSREIHILATHFFRTPASKSRTQPFAFTSTSFFLRDKTDPVSAQLIHESFKIKYVSYSINHIRANFTRCELLPSLRSKREIIRYFFPNLKIISYNQRIKTILRKRKKNTVEANSNDDHNSNNVDNDGADDYDNGDGGNDNE